MKVLRIIARLNVGGPARHVVWLTAGLQSAQCESVLVAGIVPTGEGDMGYFAASAGVEPIIIPQMSREISIKDALTVWKLYRLFAHERPDIIHTHTAKAGTVGRTAGLLYRFLTPGTLVGQPRRCRIVHTYHGHIFHSYYGALKTRLFLGIEKTLARLATDRIIVLSAQQFDEIHKKFGVGRAGQFAIIPLGLDTTAYAGWHARRNLLRDELNVEPDEILVGIVGRLTEIKNHDLFLRMAALYKERWQKQSHAARRVRFLLIGDGHLRHALEEQARRLGIDADVIFTGTRDDPENFYAALDIVALTSRNEGTPLTLLEAMANERACIATAVGGVVDLLGQKTASKLFDESGHVLCERGVLVRPDDAEAFSEGLACLIDDETLRRELGERGRRFVEQYYSKERLLTDIQGLYDELTTRSLKPSARSSRFGVKD